jgi:hypothetical protein
MQGKPWFRQKYSRCYTYMLQLNQWAKVVVRQVDAWVGGVEVDGSATNNEFETAIVPFTVPVSATSFLKRRSVGS